MSTRSRILLSLGTGIAAVAAFGLAIGACAQQEGERCQRSSDCADGLTCNLGTHLCQADSPRNDAGGGIDAQNDADVPDAAVDAAIDAPPAAR